MSAAGTRMTDSPPPQKTLYNTVRLSNGGKGMDCVVRIVRNSRVASPEPELTQIGERP